MFEIFVFEFQVRLLTVVVALMFLTPRANADAKGKAGAQILIRNPGEPGSKPFPGFVPVKPEPDLNMLQTSAAEHRFADRDRLPVNSEEAHLEPVNRKTVQPVSRLRSKADTVTERGDKEIEPVRRTRFRSKSIPRKIVLKRRKVKKFRKRPRPKPDSDGPSDMLKTQILNSGVALAPEAQRGGSLAELAFATLSAEEQESESRERVFPRNRDIQIMKSPRRKPDSSNEKDTAPSANRLRTRPQAASQPKNNSPESSDEQKSKRKNLFGDRKRFKNIIRKETRRKAERLIGKNTRPAFVPTRQSLVIREPDSPFPNFPAKKGGEVDIEVQIQEERDGRSEDDSNSVNIGFEELTLNPKPNHDSDFEIESFMPILRPEKKERQRFSAVSAVPDTILEPEDTNPPLLEEFSDFPKIPPVNQFEKDSDSHRSPIKGEPLPITQFLNPNLPVDVQPVQQPIPQPVQQPEAPSSVPAFPDIFNNPNPKARRPRPQSQKETIRNRQPLNRPQVQPIQQLPTQILPTPQPIFQNPPPTPPASFQDLSPQTITLNQNPTPQPFQSFPDQPKSSNFPSFPSENILPAIAPVRPLPNPRVVPVRPLPDPRIVPQNTNQANQPNLLSQQFPTILQEIPESPAATPLVPVGGLGDPVNQGIVKLGTSGLNSHTETRVGNLVQGQYSYTDVDGTVKVVSYKTDGPNSLPQITHTTEAPQPVHHQSAPLSIKNSASHLVHQPVPGVHGANPPPIQQPIASPTPLPLIPVAHPYPPNFPVRHHGTTVVPRKRVPEPPLQTHPSRAPIHSAKLVQNPTTVTPRPIFKSPKPPQSSKQIHPVPVGHGPTAVAHGPTLAPAQGVLQPGPAQVQHHGPPPHGPSSAPHHGPPPHGPSSAPQHIAPHNGPSLPPFVHHGPSKPPLHSPPPFPSFPTFFSHGPPHHPSPTPGNAILPAFTPSGPSKAPRFLPHPPIYLIASPTPYPAPGYHGHHPRPPHPLHHHPHSKKVPALTFFSNPSPAPPQPTPHPHPAPTPSPIISVHPETNRPTVHHPTPTSFPAPLPSSSPSFSPTPTPGLKVVNVRFPSPSPVPLLYQPNRIVFTPKPFVHTSVRPVSIHHSTPAPFHGSSRPPFVSTTPVPIFKATPTPVPHTPIIHTTPEPIFKPSPVYQPVTPVPLHLRTPMAHSPVPHSHTTPAPLFGRGPTPTPSHFFFSTPYPLTPYPPLKYTPTPAPTPFIVPANFPSNGHGFPAHIPVATARSEAAEKEVPEIAQESVNNVSVVKAPPKSDLKNKLDLTHSSVHIVVEKVDGNTKDEKPEKDALKRSIHTQRRNPKKYRTSRNYRHFYEKT